MSGPVATFDRDDAARRRIRTSLDESLLVEAAAGTGKTTVLVQRLVAMLQRGGHVGEVVAVTFTRKAAGELKLRLRQELDTARHRTEDRSQRANLEQAIARLEEARIGTIHSFCAELLRERPVEAGVDPSFEEVADDEARRLFDRAFDRWIQERLDEMPEGLRRALSRLALGGSYFGDTPLERLRSAAWSLVDWRDLDAAWRREPFDREREIDRLVEDLERLAACVGRGERQRDPLRQSLEPVLYLLAWIRRSEKASPDQPRDYDALEARLLELLRVLRREHRTGSGKYAEALPREMVLRSRKSFVEALEELGRRADADLAALLRDELWEVVERYEELKESAGKLDFLDLLLRARDLLRSSPPVRRYLQQRFRYIFVDEFQDTDPLQTEILLLLSSDDPEVDDWRDVRPLPGKLFLVGDPKQSIYRFRRADVLLYEEVKERLARRGVGVVHLSRSFRAVAPIQRAVNRAFAEVMTGDRESGSPEYIPLAEKRRAQPGQISLVALPAPKPYGWSRVAKKSISECLPDTVAAFIDWLLVSSGRTVEGPNQEQVPIRPHHICILFRRFMAWREDVTRGYTRALEARGIPHILVGARTFHQREEVETLRTALTAVEWPDDELSLYATLRGSLFSFSDDLLVRYLEKSGTLHPFRLPDGVDRELEPVVEVLERLGELHRRRNARAMVETLQELLAFARAHAAFALRPAGHQVLGNVERVCDLARSYELGGGLSFRGFVEQLNAEAEKPSSSQAPVVEEGAEGVRLMTVHNAKGLEFPVVILADLSTGLSRQSPDRTVDPNRRLCAQTLLGMSPWDLLDHEELEHRRDVAEGVRVAYVAATRARDLLVIPTVGDEEVSSWLEPLNRAVYPNARDWRRASPPPGGLEFGPASVLERPQEFDGRPEGSVRPGRHHFEEGDYDVVWWDPAALDLGRELDVGLSQEEVLSPDDGEQIASENLERYERWRRRREEVSIAGSAPRFEVLAISELEEEPPGDRRPVRYEPRSLVAGEKSAVRPSGVRFGTLVHTMLRDVALDAGREQIEELARLQGRLVDAPREEVEAAVEAVVAALAHPLLVRARTAAADRDALFRESPFLLPLDEERMLEGAIDLAFREGEAWIVIDFKTDADLEPRRQEYERQLSWYLFALERLTGQSAEGILLGV